MAFVGPSGFLGRRHGASSPAPRVAPSPRVARTTLHMATRDGLRKVVIAGGSGFVGTRISQLLVEAGCDEIDILSRSGRKPNLRGVTSYKWTPGKQQSNLGDILRGADAVINLSGELIAQRWSPAVKDRIVSSRISATNTLVNAMIELDQNERPKTLVSSSAVGYYGISDSKTFTESSPPANDFTGSLCQRWESAAEKAKRYSLRVVIIRNGIVLGQGGGALAKMLPLFKLGLGGPLGNGQQWVSWIALDDIARVFVRAAGDRSMSGAYNGVAPNPVRSKEMTGSLAKALNRPHLLPAPALALKAVFLGGATILLDGQKVEPERLEKCSFDYKYTDINQVMREVAAPAASKSSKK